MAANQSTQCYPSDYYTATKVCDGCCQHWKDFRVPLDSYNVEGCCILTLEDVLLNFSFVCACGQRNEVDF